MSNENHLVVREGNAFLEISRRLECLSPACNHAMIISRRRMSPDEWSAKVVQFLKEHPCKEVRQL